MATTNDYVCSPMTGQLVDSSGAPVAGVEIKRVWHWHGKSGEDLTKTDADGKFGFGVVHAKRGLFGGLPAENRVQQRFYAKLPDGEFNFLYIPTSGLEPNHETDGKTFNVRCRTGAEADGSGFHWGTCELMP